MTKEEALAFLISIKNRKLSKEDELKAQAALQIIGGSWAVNGG